MLLHRRLGLMAILLGFAGGSCASPTADVNLAPIYLRSSTPQWQTVEVVGGLARFREDHGITTWAVNPLFWRQRRPDGHVEADFLALLGRYQYVPHRNNSKTRLFPLFWYDSERLPDGAQDTDWMVLPFFLGGSSSDGKEDYFAFFPFYGTMKNWLTWDEVEFILFPFHVRTEKAPGVTTNHWMWPFYGRQTGAAEGWNLWPFYGTFERPGRSTRSYVLWPFWIESVEDLHHPEPRRSWFLFPLVGRIEQGDYVATTYLWPFLGRAERPSTNYYSWQLWPILKFEDGGMDDQGKPSKTKVKRILPFYLHYEDEHTSFSSWMFPLFWKRHDEFGNMVRDGYYAVPLWWKLDTHRFDDLDGDGVPEQTSTETLTRVWPFYANQAEQDHYDLSQEGSALDIDGNLIPLDKEDGMHGHVEAPYFGEALARNLTRPLALWQRHQQEPSSPVVERAFLGLYHSVESDGHSRWSMPILGGQWTEPNGTKHHSYLFGLLRWQSGGSDNGLEAPAFPGPGWPDLSRQARQAQPATPPPDFDGEDQPQ